MMTFLFVPELERRGKSWRWDPLILCYFSWSVW